jgi:hypothetical protein
MFVLAGSALALPSERPDDTPMVDGRVNTIEQVGSNVWVGGQFTKVQARDGAVLDDVQNVAVFDSATGEYKDIAPMLGGEGSNVVDMDVYADPAAGKEYVAIAGKFSGPTDTKKNLVLVDGASGEVVRWYTNAPALQSVLAAPQLGRVYGGGVSLSAFDFSTGKKLWTRAKTTVDAGLRVHAITAGYRDLELDADDGQTIWAACGCDAVQGPDGVANPAKAMVKLSAEGAHDPSWKADAGSSAFGISLVEANGALYVGTGGSDFLARYPKVAAYSTKCPESAGLVCPVWKRDTSGSAQAVEVMGDQLVVGGHFWEVADQNGDNCGARVTKDPSKLDPNDECQTRYGLAVYSPDGALDPTWDPKVEGRYNLVWALRPDPLASDRLHFGGEFTSVSGIRQTFYARLSQPSGDVVAPVSQPPTHDLAAAGSTIGTSTIPVKMGWSATDDASGVASYEVQQSTDGGAYAKVASTASTSRTLSLQPGGAYQFRVRATDEAGNVGTWAEGPRFALDVRQEGAAGALAYSGGWADEALPTAFDSGTKYAREAGDVSRLDFAGTDVAWVGHKGPDQGKAEVWLDGTKVDTVDLYASSAKPRSVLYGAALDSAGPHTLEVRVLGAKRSVSSDRRVDVDAFVALR